MTIDTSPRPDSGLLPDPEPRPVQYAVSRSTTTSSSRPTSFEGRCPPSSPIGHPASW